MELKELCCSLEYAQKLIEKGIIFNTEFYWFKDFEEWELIHWGIRLNPIVTGSETKNNITSGLLAPALISGELDRILHRLGFTVQLTDSRKFDPDDPNNIDGYWYDLLTLDLSDEHAGIHHSFIFHNPADAKAHGLLWLVEQQIISLEDIVL